jgi:hypothetical protein
MEPRVPTSMQEACRRERRAGSDLVLWVHALLSSPVSSIERKERERHGRASEDSGIRRRARATAHAAALRGRRSQEARERRAARRQSRLPYAPSERRGRHQPALTRRGRLARRGDARRSRRLMRNVRRRPRRRRLWFALVRARSHRTFSASEHECAAGPGESSAAG